jgi:L-asparaginase
MIKILITGGTLDKIYNELTGELVFKETILVDLLNQGRSMVETHSEILFLKDSLEITEADRALILQACIDSPEKKILITHGTDTLTQTAQLLGDKIKHKTIVLLGAMIPARVDNSDALFNLGLAMGAVQCQENGVYVAMNGQIFKFDSVQKNKTLGIFETT